MTSSTARIAAYQHALQIANASSEQPGLDGWWAILRREEAAQLAAELGVEPSDEPSDEPAQDAADDADGWAAYTSDYHGAKRWSRAHYFTGYGRLPVCGRDPGPAAEWAHEGDTRTTGRCARCARMGR